MENLRSQFEKIWNLTFNNKEFMMPFVYLAGPDGPNQRDTFNLAMQHGVIAKSFFRNVDAWAADNNLGALTGNSCLYLAFRNQNGVLGAVQTFVLQNAVENNSTTPLADNDAIQDHYNGDPPDVMGTVNEGTNLQHAIQKLGYTADPKINMLTVICVSRVEQDEANGDVLDALNTWYAALTHKMTTVHNLPENEILLE